jgi:pantetheine-phosphate adenylyltransferase
VTTAIYPGSFDPMTFGHIDIIERSARLFDNVIVAILINAQKAPLFSVDERIDIMREILKPRFQHVEVAVFHGLLVDYAKERNAQVIVRGIRAVTDYEYEFQMALMNRRLDPSIETVFMMPAEQYSYLSSRLVKEIAELGGSVAGLVPEIVEQRLKQRFGRGGTGQEGRVSGVPK